MQKCLIYRSVLVLCQDITLCNGGVGPHSLIIFIYHEVGQKNGLSNFPLTIIFSVILIFLKTLQNDEGRQHNV